MQCLPQLTQGAVQFGRRSVPQSLEEVLTASFVCGDDQTIHTCATQIELRSGVMAEDEITIIHEYA
jgi:hypothetical protein